MSLESTADAKCERCDENLAELLRKAMNGLGTDAWRSLLTHPTLCFVGEEVKARTQSLKQITLDICDAVCAREEAGLPFGVVLIPEGLVDFVPEVSALDPKVWDGEVDGVTKEMLVELGFPDLNVNVKENRGY